MTSKAWCIWVVALFAVVMTLMALFNYVCDPFGVFGDRFFDWYSYNMTNNPRTSKIAYLERELEKDSEKYDSYIIGCSSTSSFPTEAFSEKLNCSFYNMIMYGADMADVEKTVEYLAENHTVKNIVLNVYLENAVVYDVCANELTLGLHAKVSKESKTAFYARHLFLNPSYSFAKLKAYYFEDEYLNRPFDVFDVESGEYDKRKRDAEAVSELDSYFESYPVFLNYPKRNSTMPHIKENADSVKRIKELCDRKGINLITVTAPVYYEYFNYFSKNDIVEFYKELAKASGGFYDFAVSSVSCEPRYFYDETHFKNDVGNMMIARIFGDNQAYLPGDFGAFVTEETAEERVEGFYNMESDESIYTTKLPVLLYHHIDENLTTADVMTPQTFDRQMKLIAENGYTAVTTQDIVDYIEKGKPLPEKSVLITFDDGYRSNLEVVGTILRKYGLKATVFAIGVLDGSEVYKDTDHPCIPHFSVEQAKEYADVIEVQSHSYDLHQNARLEGNREIYENMLITEGENEWDYAKRIKDDCDKMQALLGCTPTAIAFPHGKYDILLQSILNESGIKLSFSTVGKTHTLVKGLSQSGYAIGRYTIYESTTDEVLMAILGR